MSKNDEAVDVLAVLQQSAEFLRNEAGRSESTGLHIAAAEAEEARAAVAELIAADREYNEALFDYEQREWSDAICARAHDRLKAAKARRAAALARIGGAA